jgi:anti-anti-sigma factor
MGEHSADSVDRAAFQVQKCQAEQAVVLAVTGDVDMVTAPQLAEAIDAALSSRPAGLIVDLSKVQFLASAGMTVLVTAQAQVVPPTRFAVVADGPATSRPMKLMGIDSTFALYRTRDTALAGIADE